MLTIGDPSPPSTPAGRAVIQLFADTDGMPVRWRLLGGNNRELGRGHGEFVDPDACRASVVRLQAAEAELETLVARSAPSAWTWTLTLAGVPVAFCGHGYDRLIRCRQGAVHFRALLVAAELATVVTLTRSRRWNAAPGRPLLLGRSRR